MIGSLRMMAVVRDGWGLLIWVFLIASGCADEGASSEAESWLMFQDSTRGLFAIDDHVDPSCPPESLWSGDMTLSGVDPNTVFFRESPGRLAFSVPTAEFVAGFGRAFTSTTGGDPTAALHWQDRSSSESRHALVRLRAGASASPDYDEDAQILTYRVCGGTHHDPITGEPLSEEQQAPPDEAPRATGGFLLIIDGSWSCAFRIPLCP